MFKVPKIGSWYYFCNILRKNCRNYFWVLLRCKTFRYLKSVLSFSLLLVLVRLFSFFFSESFSLPFFFFSRMKQHTLLLQLPQGQRKDSCKNCNCCFCYAPLFFFFRLQFVAAVVKLRVTCQLIDVRQMYGKFGLIREPCLRSS